MNRVQFQAFMQAHYDEIVGINKTKGHDYAGDEDALRNFKIDSERFAKIAQNSPHMLKWYVYLDKHLSAIWTFLEEGAVASEPIDGRFHDAILYLFLGMGLIHEHSEQVLLARDDEQ